MSARMELEEMKLERDCELLEGEVARLHKCEHALDAHFQVQEQDLQGLDGYGQWGKMHLCDLFKAQGGATFEFEESKHSVLSFLETISDRILWKEIVGVADRSPHIELDTTKDLALAAGEAIEKYIARTAEVEDIVADRKRLLAEQVAENDELRAMLANMEARSRKLAELCRVSDKLLTSDAGAPAS